MQQVNIIMNEEAPETAQEWRMTSEFTSDEGENDE